MDIAAFDHSTRPSANNRNGPQSRRPMRPWTQIVWGQYTDASSPSTVGEYSTIDIRNGPQSGGHLRPVGNSPGNPIGCGESIIAASSSPSTAAESSIRNNRNGPQSGGEVRPIGYSPGNQVVLPGSFVAVVSPSSTVAESLTTNHPNGPKSWDEVRPAFLSSSTQDVRAESIASALAAAAAVVVGSASSPSPLPETVVESPSAATASLPADDSSSTGETRTNSDGPNGYKDKTLAWSKPSSNGAASDVKLVMDASSWPALSKSTMTVAPNVKLPAEVLKVLADASSAPLSLGARSPPSFSTEGQVIDNAKTNTPVPTSPKPMRRNGSNASSNGSPQPHSAIQGLTPATWSHNSSTKDNTHRSGYALQQTHNINDPSQQPHHRDSFKNRTGGPNYRGDGARQHSHWGRREQHRGNQDWNINRNFNGRGTHMQPRGVPRFTRPAPPQPRVPPPYSSAQYFPPPPVPPYGGPYGSTYGFPELAPQLPYYSAPTPEPFSGVSYIPPMPPCPVSFPAQDPQLHTRIVRQIDYYFSFDNLIIDMHLRKQMDDLGWVPIRLIAGFPRIRELTRNIQIIKDAIRTSSVVEIQGDKIRRRNDWQRWLLPASFVLPEISGSHSRNLSQDELAKQFQSISLEQKTKNNGAGESQPSSGEPN